MFIWFTQSRNLVSLFQVIYQKALQFNEKCGVPADLKAHKKILRQIWVVEELSNQGMGYRN